MCKYTNANKASKTAREVNVAHQEATMQVGTDLHSTIDLIGHILEIMQKDQGITDQFNLAFDSASQVNQAFSAEAFTALVGALQHSTH